MIKFHKDGTLPQDEEIFVFGSNLAGIHGAGAAKIAHYKFGAVLGKGNGGPYGKSYAIPTKDNNIKTMPLSDIKVFVDAFVDFTKVTPDYRWFVTRVGCGLAGYTDKKIAPMFRGAVNCSFAQEWQQYLEK